jgi:response regulator RpfG family c-di-GMP phosphodiesterase
MTSRDAVKHLEMTTAYPHTLLLVDDEASILSSLKRLFRRQGYSIITAQNGMEALEKLDAEASDVSLIISDQRMPGMSGSQFLAQAAELAPNAMRFTLTGYADLNAVIDAVNTGQIHRYLTKPWNDNEMLLQVRSALEQVEMQHENRRLRELTERQNQQLIRLNQELEKKVNERTWALQLQNKRLQSVNRGLEQSLMDAVRLLWSLVAASNPRLGRYMEAVAVLARGLAADAGLSEADQELVEMAGLVHDMGLLGMSETMIETDPKFMTADELGSYRQHPVIAAVSLSSVQRLGPVADLVRSHHEHLDGSGFPDKLKGDQIPMGSRILAVAADFNRVIHLWPRPMQPFLSCARRHLDSTTMKTMDIGDDQLREFVAEKVIEQNSGRRYDLDLARLLLKRAAGRRPYKGVMHLPLEALREGMVLRQPLRLNDGRLLLNKGSVLDARAIQSLRGIGDRELFEGTIEVAEPMSPTGEGTFAR